MVPVKIDRSEASYAFLSVDCDSWFTNSRIARAALQRIMRRKASEQVYCYQDLGQKIG